MKLMERLKPFHIVRFVFLGAEENWYLNGTLSNVQNVFCDEGFSTVYKGKRQSRC